MNDTNKQSDNKADVEALRKKKYPPERLAGLKPYQPGQSGNPGGRPRGKSITAELRKLIDEGTNAEDMAKILFSMAKRMSPDQLSAFKELLNRTDGKVPDTHKIESDVPIYITFKEVERDA